MSVQCAALSLRLPGAVAIGTFLGGPLGDRFGRKFVIWFSILGVLPFTLALPYANLFWTVCCRSSIGLILSSAFSAIVVYAQELMPGRVGMIAGLFFGFAFGLGGIGAAVLGELADRTSIDFVYEICVFLPLIGLVAWFLPNIEKQPPGPPDLCHPSAPRETRKARKRRLSSVGRALICNRFVKPGLIARTYRRSLLFCLLSTCAMMESANASSSAPKS